MAQQMGHPYDMLLGRKTYEIFAGYRPQHGQSELGAGINKATKYVASHRPMQFDWDKSVLLQGNLVDEVRKLKADRGPELQVHGSGNLIQTLFKNDLVDELWLKVFPITLGTGQAPVPGRHDSSRLQGNRFQDFAERSPFRQLSTGRGRRDWAGRFVTYSIDRAFSNRSLTLRLHDLSHGVPWQGDSTTASRERGTLYGARRSLAQRAARRRVSARPGADHRRGTRSPHSSSATPTTAHSATRVLAQHVLDLERRHLVAAGLDDVDAARGRGSGRCRRRAARRRRCGTSRRGTPSRVASGRRQYSRNTPARDLDLARRRRATRRRPRRPAAPRRRAAARRRPAGARRAAGWRAPCRSRSCRSARAACGR